MVVGTADRNLVVFNLQNPQTEFKRINSPLKYQMRCVAAFPDQQGFWVGSIEGRVGVHHLDDSQQSKNFTFKCHRDGSETCSVISFTSILYITLLQLLDLMVHLIFGTRIVNSGSRPCQGAGNLYLAVHSIMMARYLCAWCVMTGVMGQKITTLQQQRLISICTCHRFVYFFVHILPLIAYL
ncbi:hypothetical protein KPL71_021128 [Citrus sinensis]|uniref:Uncharacterized protein n=1 Tax=Citrus sinensis TaxID=2711 RepID=A0ACB8JD85_CITSI|nr:hypothetical protein KPL71_021128 [Citrus sinensis]